jgi:hypothetical protein
MPSSKQRAAARRHLVSGARAKQTASRRQAREFAGRASATLQLYLADARGGTVAVAKTTLLVTSYHGVPAGAHANTYVLARGEHGSIGPLKLCKPRQMVARSP